MIFRWPQVVLSAPRAGITAKHIKFLWRCAFMSIYCRIVNFWMLAYSITFRKYLLHPKLEVFSNFFTLLTGAVLYLAVCFWECHSLSNICFLNWNVGLDNRADIERPSSNSKLWTNPICEWRTFFHSSNSHRVALTPVNSIFISDSPTCFFRRMECYAHYKS